MWEMGLGPGAVVTAMNLYMCDGVQVGWRALEGINGCVRLLPVYSRNPFSLMG